MNGDKKLQWKALSREAKGLFITLLNNMKDYSQFQRYM